jgi:DNA-binding HxlR family transcriptional regulator
MAKKSFGQTCAVSRTLDIVGERWTLLIIRELLPGTLRFQDFQEKLPGIVPSLLSDRLKTLEEHGIISRSFYSEHPPRAAYALTPKGRELGMVVSALGRWGRRHLGAKTTKAAKHVACGHALELHYYCPHCEETVSVSGVAVVERPARTR